ncbi:unnamed protein product [Arabis nemorensis]|uniref:PWWP domain-containing protein n=1 Tax=Arabis nemorensis TaxID=586526 RepID=A0A565BSC1_9BRAS|nr:unnamed protein product [Arabis nemorensis]
MGNFVTTGSRVSENGERAVLGDLKDGADEKLMDIVNDSGPMEDCFMSEGASSLLNMKQEEENGFHVGDFVWVEQVNSCHQWWPGKIYDSSDASDLALKNMHNGKLLVAYFGNGDFDWCNPSQLKPFLENFKEFSKISDSTSFLRAVKEAVGEIGERVERLLVCDEEALVSPLVVNSGIKEGVVVPDVRREVVLSLVLEKSGIFLGDVKSLAKTVRFNDLLEIEVLKRKISAFYRSKGRFDLAKYDEYGYIIGLEHKEDEDSLSFDKSSCQRSLKRCSDSARKKRKCSDDANLGDVATTGSTTLRRRVSEISKIENACLKQMEEASNGKNQERVLSPRKRKNKRFLDDDNGIEKREESNDSNHLEASEKKEDSSGMERVVELSTPLVSLCKRVKVDVSPSVESNNGNGETILQTGKRERKKSKYLSPEYLTDFSLRARKSKIESESSQIRAAERMTKNSPEKAIDFARLGTTTPEEMLDLIRAAALGMQYLKDYNSSCDMIKEFVSNYRSFAYNGGDYNKRDISDEMKQQEVDEKEQTGNEPSETVLKNKREESEKQISGVELFITTDLGSTLPSKDDLIQTYKKFGALDKERSYMFNNNSCANIVFSNVSDGEEAFYKSLEECPFVTTTSRVTFKLKYLSSDSLENPNEKNETETRKGVMEIEFLKEKLEEMRSLLDQSEGVITEELKIKLEDESRNLLDKVSKISVPAS